MTMTPSLKDLEKAVFEVFKDFYEGIQLEQNHTSFVPLSPIYTCNFALPIQHAFWQQYDHTITIRIMIIWSVWSYHCH